MHRRQRQNFRPLLLPQFGCYDAAHSRANGLAGLVDQHTGIVVKLDYAAVRPLPLLCCAHHDGMPYVSSADLVRCADGDAVAGLGAKVSLFLHYDDYAIAWGWPLEKFSLQCAGTALLHTDFGSPLRSQHVDALDNGGAGVVDAVDQGLDCGA